MTETSPRKSAGTSPLIALVAFLLDASLITLFAALGRDSHELDATFGGLFRTAWPFLAGLVLLWIVTAAWRRPLSIVRTGMPVWIGTVLIGMIFRALSDQGTALPFVLVATGVIGLMLVGWRAIVTLVRRLKR